MQISLGESVEKAFRYQTDCGGQETLYITNKKMLWERSEQTDAINYAQISQVEKTVHIRMTGGCVFFFVVCLLSLICCVAAILYGVWEGKVPYCVAAGILGMVALVGFVFSVKLKRKYYGVKVYLNGQGEIWLDIGDKKLSALVANEIATKVWSV